MGRDSALCSSVSTYSVFCRVSAFFEGLLEAEADISEGTDDDDEINGTHSQGLSTKHQTKAIHIPSSSKSLSDLSQLTHQDTEKPSWNQGLTVSRPIQRLDGGKRGWGWTLDTVDEVFAHPGLLCLSRAVLLDSLMLQVPSELPQCSPRIRYGNDLQVLGSSLLPSSAQSLSPDPQPQVLPG